MNNYKNTAEEIILKEYILTNMGVKVMSSQH